MGVSVDFYRVTVGKFAGQKLGGKHILQSLLNRPLQRPCAKGRVVTLIHNQLAGTVGEFELNSACLQTLGELIELDSENLS